MKTKLILFALLSSGIVHAQKESVNSYNMFWGGYYSYIQLNSKWNINSDIQHRTKNGFEIQSQSLIRTAAVYKINKLLNVSVGAAHFRYYITNTLTRGEWRPWQEFGATVEYGRVKITNRLRSEERFNQIAIKEDVTNDYKYNWRFRYKVDLEIPIIKQGERVHSLAFGNELMINAGKVILNPFDQNRSFVSFNYQVSKNVKLQFQYMYIVQYIAAQNNYDKISVIRFNIHHTIPNVKRSNK